MSCLRIVKNISMVLVVAVAMSLEGCADGDMATVRIEINLPESAMVAFTPSLFDQVLYFITMSGYVNADTPPSGSAISSINITITGNDIAPISQNVDAVSGYIEIDVPAGNERVFQIRATDSDTRLVYGREIIIDLIPGEIRNLTVQMLGIPYEISASAGNGFNVTASLYGEISYAIEMQVSESQDGPFESLDTSGGVFFQETGFFSFNDMSSSVQIGDFIKVRANYQSINGVFSDPVLVNN